ncbi:MAG: PIG-L deacetylase family protein [Pirellulaceae bacterium]
MSDAPLKLLILGAHPDDAEYHAGGIAALYRQAGHTVKMVSVTDGGAGHHRRASEELVALRRLEAAAAGEVIGAEYVTWDFPDGALQPTLEVRRRIIREIRTYQPDLVLTHRTNDYHPDHRAVGQAVQDASYMVTVPLVEPDVPSLRRDPVVAYMPDLFTRPCPLRADVVLDIEPYFDAIVNMLACHRSQVFEFLPYNERIDDQVPSSAPEQLAWLRQWVRSHLAPRADRFDEALTAAYGERANSLTLIEVFEVSEYAGKFDDEARRRLFWWTEA